MSRAWDSLTHDSWARELGFVRVPLWDPDYPLPDWIEEASVLLDGPVTSLVLVSSETDVPLEDQAKLRWWAWSADVRHVLVLRREPGEMILQRWDSATCQRFPLVESADGARELVEACQRVPGPLLPTVISHTLRLFRVLRRHLQSLPRTQEPIAAIRIFTALLVGAEAVRRGEVSEADWRRIARVGDLLGLLDDLDKLQEWREELPPEAMNASLGELAERLVEPMPHTDLILEPALLLRHAAGQLYQEAHIILEKDAQLRLPGLVDEEPPRGILERYVRFTPPPVARMLVNQALDALDRATGLSKRQELTVLDPACGSGVFLQELVRELIVRGYRGSVVLRGIDISPVAACVARLCIARAAAEAQAHGMKVKTDVIEADALELDWGRPDLVLMNPPFVGWTRLARGLRDKVRAALSGVPAARPDLCLAFIWKAFQHVAQGGVLASVVPSSFFEAKSAASIREELQRNSTLCFLGRFRGYSVFAGSIVEPGFFVVLKGRTALHQRETVTVLLADEAAKEAAMRALRSRTRPTAHRDENKLWEIFVLRQSEVVPASWTPRSRQLLELVGRLKEMGMPRVRELFSVRQGARTGNREVFVIPEAEFKQLPRRERKFFRPVAGSRTIRNGKLGRELFVFYPYNGSGLIFRSEEELRAAVPQYYERHLAPRRSRLAQRQSLRGRPWWALSTPRTWQAEPVPKLVSKSFGGSGGFAIDPEGRYVVLQGYAWFWLGCRRRSVDNIEPADEAGVQRHFFATDLPWAYLALLNSCVFECLLSCFCPRMQGGQFDLGNRFVGEVFLPDLSAAQLRSEIVLELAELGRQIARSGLQNTERLDEAAARAYGLSASDIVSLCE